MLVANFVKIAPTDIKENVYVNICMYMYIRFLTDSIWDLKTTSYHSLTITTVIVSPLKINSLKPHFV